MVDGPPPAVAAVVLAGGRSTRMGRDKASLLVAGRSMLARTLAAVAAAGAREVVVVAAPGQSLPPLPAGVSAVRDPVEGEGPLAAIATGLAATGAPIALLLGCDTPFVRPALLRLLAARAREHAIVVPAYRGRAQPLCSAVRREVLANIEAHLAAGARAASVLTDDPRSFLLPEETWRDADPEGVSFAGVNTPEERGRAEALAARLDADHNTP